MFREYDTVDGGKLLYEIQTEKRDHLPYQVEVSRRLLGFAKVTDWEKIRSELTRRGLGVGAIHHLPVFED